MTRLEAYAEQAGSIVILGHVNPDGDCAGSCLAVYNYLKDVFPEKTVDVYLEPVSRKFAYLAGYDQIQNERNEKTYELCICMDSSDKERLGALGSYFDTAERTLCIDHHVTNKGYADDNIIDGAASSTCELLFTLLEEEKVSRAVAECIYTGLVHDTGVFKHSNTTQRTMETAGKMIEKGIDFGRIVDDSFFTKTYYQTQILGRALLESVLFMDGQCIFTVIRKKDMDFYNVDKSDLDGIVDQLRVIEGVEAAIFLYEVDIQTYKVSMRSNRRVDVSRIAQYFGGGGHVRAAGCTMSGSPHDVINNLSEHIEKQLEQEKADA